MNVEQISISELKPYEKNARKNKAAVEVVKKSISRFGFKSPILVDENNVILAGHTRLEAAKELDLKEVPVIKFNDLSESQKKAFRIMDNKSSEFADWDYDLLKEELYDLEGSEDFDFTGFSNSEIGDIWGQEETPEINEETVMVESYERAKSKTKIQKGEIYQLGDHRLMCGDSTDPLTVSKLMNRQWADLVFTDPPYGMKKENEGVLNDNLNHKDLLEFNKKWIPISFDYLNKVGSWYCWGIDQPLMDIYSEILKPLINMNLITFRNLITWNKTHTNPTYRVNGFVSPLLRSYFSADEKCLFVMKGVQGFNTNSDNYYEGWEPLRKYLIEERDKVGWTSEDVVKITGKTTATHYFSKSQWSLPTKEHYEKMQKASNKESFKKDYDQLKQEYYSTRSYFNGTHDKMKDTWTFEITGKEEREETGDHATPKPVKLCARAIRSSSREGDLVFDLFGGSGSTLIACEQLARKCYTMELDPVYCQVIIDRWENLTGKKAEKI